ncbi:toprim domain-containing protein [Robertmurraya andreesenii]|uniref:DNA primase n=1 Tax=Anoxybacillus andreesenii TaxID=1325932 RepID=A0ABT9V1Z3_9BACL|nr:toprim domain-containing protein [Robertmurraya andreesenii]MDQ0154970.1 hypothetical protein [Robertmurraya andreesenii]
MANIKIQGQTVDVDVEQELREFNWTRPRWTSDKLIAASPFRYDNTPSFFVNLDGDYAGTWGDSGYYDDEWAKGGLVKLLAFLRNETWEEAEDYLLDAYAPRYDGESITLTLPKLKIGQPKLIELSPALLAKYSEDYAYLQSRGISEEVQRNANIRYDANSRAVVLPWFDAQNRLRNVKYRTTYGKTFWYHKGATPVRELVYGIELLSTYSQAEGLSVVLEEAEIDALSWRTVGMPAIAVGGANFTDKQAEIIKRSPITTLLLGGDNDKAGRKFAEQVTAKLRGHVELRRIEKPERFKDANEALVAGYDLRNYQSRPISSINVDKFRRSYAKILL